MNSQTKSTDKRSKRRPKLRFGLKSLFVLATGIGLFFGVLFPYLRQAHVENLTTNEIKSRYTNQSPPKFFSNYLFSDGEDQVDEPRAPAWLQRMFGENIGMSVNTALLPSVLGEQSDSIEKHKEILQQLYNLKGLKQLGIFGWPNENVAGLSELKGVTDIELVSWTKLKDLSALSSLKQLERFSVTDAKMDSIDALTNCSGLKKLRLSNCANLKDIIAVSHLPHLSDLNLVDCGNLESLLPLEALTNLESIALGPHPKIDTFDFAWISNNKNLRNLQLQGFSKFKNIEHLPRLTELQKLDLSECHGFDSLPSLKPLTKLNRLELKKCSIVDLDSLAGLSSLLTVVVDYCERLESIEGIKNCHRIGWLRLHNCPLVKSLDPLSNIERLDQLTLSGFAAIENLDFLSSVPVDNLFIYDCPNLSDITAINTESVSELHIYGCDKVTQQQIVEAKEACGLLSGTSSGPAAQ